jgi:hypothetical protein
MEHAIFYPWLKNTYEINLYEIGNKRIVGFIHAALPSYDPRRDQIPLILNYIKHTLESDKQYWHEKLNKAYSKNSFKEMREISLNLLAIIKEVSNRSPNPQYFTEKYREILKIMSIDEKTYPVFLNG